MHLVSHELSQSSAKQKLDLMFLYGKVAFQQQVSSRKRLQENTGRRLFRRTNYLLNELEKNHYFGIRINLDS